MSQTFAQLINGKSATVEFSTGSATTPSVAFSGDTNTGIYSPGADQVAISTNGSGRLFVDASGNIGINTSPSSLGASVTTLEIKGGSTTRSGGLRVSSSDSSVKGAFYIYDGVGVLGTESATPLDLYTGNSPRLRITSSGLVGIGTSTVDQLLHLKASAPKFKIEGTGTSDEVGIHFAANANNWFIRSDNSTGQNTFSIKSGTPASSTHRLLIDSSGNVGIGTTSPQQLLHVDSGSGGANAAITLRATGYSGNQFNFYAQVTPEVISVIESTERAIAFKANGSERARIDSSGRLLVGTSSASNTFTTALLQGNAADTTGDGVLRLARGAATPASGNGLGYIVFSDSGHVDAAYIFAARDGGTWSGSSKPTRLVFSTTADGASSPTERMRISNAGGVFINGATSATSGNPNDGFHVGSNGSHLGGDAVTIGDGLATARWRMATGSYNCRFLQNNGSGTYLERSYITNSTGAYVAVSDQRAKKDIIDASYGIDELKQLRPVSYLMKDQDETTARRNLGFIAQEVLGVVPEAVNVPADPEQMYGLESSALIPVLVSSLQEAIAKIETLEAKVAALESA